MRRRLSSFLLILIGSLLLVNSAGAVEKGSLQQLIDDTPAGGVLELEAMTYEGNIVIPHPITIVGQPGTIIKGDQTNNVIKITSDDVTLDSLVIEGSGMSRSSSEEYSGVRVMANGAVLKNLTITDSFHGIYLNKTRDTTMSGITVIGHGTEDLGNRVTVFPSHVQVIISSDSRWKKLVTVFSSSIQIIIKFIIMS